jgi:octaheme c-type cytochrome (tetrathionate reductase family)
MTSNRSRWWIGALAVVGALAVPLAVFYPRGEAPRDQPWRGVPSHPPHTDHAALLAGPYPDGPSVTRACLKCHDEAGEQVMRTAHWRWETDPVNVPGRAEPVRGGKKNVVNNFCISIQSNWSGCTSCHAGYGWEDAGFDFRNAENVDCLVCHDRTGTYVKADGGYPAPGVDLVAVAKSVAAPQRDNCGGCHFKGGGGDAVKHGDLDPSLFFPRERVDVHMGRHGMVCTDCHRTENHLITGRSISVSMDHANRITCTDCHAAEPHRDERVNAHVGAVACQSCHIREVAIREATKVHWDWSAAGQDLPEDKHTYLKEKGRFVYAQHLVPEYHWFDGTADRYLIGDRIDPSRPTPINLPRGSVADRDARIWPFKVHRGDQIFDAEYRHLLIPKTVGPDGYWETFDWDAAARLGSRASGLRYSGKYGFAETEMYWPLTHMVGPKEEALRCHDCHESGARIDWRALGYSGDPVRWGGREGNGLAARLDGGER